MSEQSLAAAPVDARPGALAADDTPPPTTTRRPPDKPTPTLVPPPATVSVIGDRGLNLRAGPGTEYPILGVLPPGVDVPVVARTLDGLWLVIEIEGDRAWVASWLVAVDGDLNAVGIANAPDLDNLTVTPIAVIEATASAAATEQASGDAEDTQPAVEGILAEVLPLGGLNVRQGPGQDFAVLGGLAEGETVEVTGRWGEGDNIWYQVKFRSWDGWIAAWLTELSGGTLEDIPAVEAPTLEEIAASAAEAAAQPPAPPPANPVPGGGVATAGFELGGQTFGIAGAAGYMHQAGMTWVKYQLRYSPGQDPGSAAGPIGEAHSNGLKILLTVLGSPDDVASMGMDAYFAEYANFVGGVASLGPDAIEVWNEENCDREWPVGQIDPAAYTRMLAAAYNAIKSVNPGVMVISGAPTPTGAEGALGTDRVWNDIRFLQGMVTAGAANYMDCVGVHYNEGIVPPTWNSGDPRDDYYTRYLPGMVNVYSMLGKPLCFTELGYLTPEGYGSLPSWFAWAQNVTVSQQAAWLADAAVYLSNSNTRLMIVWNVDLTAYGDDPMGGYAIVRPGGGCPACGTLGAVMGQ